MTEAVIDASIVIKWFRPRGEADIAPSLMLREKMRSGELVVFAPPLLPIEIVNVAGRRWKLGSVELVDLAHALESLPFDIRQPALGSVAAWTARGLTVYDATYVALAEAERVPLITADEQILDLARAIAARPAEAVP